MYKIFRLPSSLKVCRSSFVLKTSTVIAGVLTGLIPICSEQARADEPCGRDDYQYVERIASGMQIFASKVTKSGRFTVKEEYPGDTTETIVVSFSDHKEKLFVHKIVGISALTPTEFRPSITKGGDPGFIVILAQGNIGECQYSMFVRNERFVVIPRGVKWYKQ